MHVEVKPATHFCCLGSPYHLCMVQLLPYLRAKFAPNILVNFVTLKSVHVNMVCNM